MEIKRHDASPILSQAVEHGNTVYLAGIVADDVSQDIKGQTRQILDKIDRLPWEVRQPQIENPVGQHLGHRHQSARRHERGVDNKKAASFARGLNSDLNHQGCHQFPDTTINGISCSSLS
jgi:hypothetical protein